MGSRLDAHTPGPLTRDLYIPEVLFRTACVMHNAAKDEYCFTIPSVNLEGAFCNGICNARAKKAGMNGRISHASLVRYMPKVKHGK